MHVNKFITSKSDKGRFYAYLAHVTLFFVFCPIREIRENAKIKLNE